MKKQDTQPEIKFDLEGLALHAEFVRWFETNRDRLDDANPGVPRWQLELRAWPEFKKERKV